MMVYSTGCTALGVTDVQQVLQGRGKKKRTRPRRIVLRARVESLTTTLYSLYGMSAAHKYQVCRFDFLRGVNISQSRVSKAIPLPYST